MHNEFTFGKKDYTFDERDEQALYCFLCLVKEMQNSEFQNQGFRTNNTSFLYVSKQP